MHEDTCQIMLNVAAPVRSPNRPNRPNRPNGSPPHQATATLLGGRRTLGTLPVPQTRADVHSALVNGVSYAILVHLVSQLHTLTLDEVAQALGMSSRTLRRHQEQPDKPMPPDLASRTWHFAELLTLAAEVMGGHDAAERWMAAPAVGLDGARPIELMRTLQGAELVSDLLGRLEHGVYS